MRTAPVLLAVAAATAAAPGPLGPASMGPPPHPRARARGAARGGPDEAEVERLRAALPTLVVERVPGAGHYIYEEDPGAVVRAVHAVSGPG